MDILVIGGSGFIGQNVAARLLKSGYGVSIYAKDCKQYTHDCECYCRDLLTDDGLSDLLKKFQVVIYLATASTPQSSMEEKHLVYDKDIPMILKLLDACVESGICRIIYASSGGTVYGENSNANQEDIDCWPICHYAVGKLMIEKILNLYNKLYDMENVSLRISNPYGMGQTKESGIGAVTIFTNHILRGEQVLLYGDGTMIRDYIGIEYVADAFQRALEWKFDNNISPVFNIGSGKGITLNHLISVISSTVGKEAHIVYLPARIFDVKYNYLDIQKAITHLGYIPPTDLIDEISSYVLQIKENLGI